MGVKSALGKLGYGALFTLGLPLLLFALANSLDHSGWLTWPVPLSVGPGIAMLVVGGGLMTRSMWLLWRDGKGLPMNAYPTTQFVTRSSYRWLAHPIYVGFFLAALGVAGMAQSPATFWVVAPLCALATTALVVGYEGPALRQRFGCPKRAPLLGLPYAGSERPALLEAIGAALVSLGPWAFLYWALSHVPAAADARNIRMPWELGMPQPSWAVWVYSAAYPLILATPFLCFSRTDLRRWVRSAWTATGLGITLLLAFPNVAEFIGATHTGATAWLLEQNRMFDAAWLAAPSFHAAWAVLAAVVYAHNWPRLRFGIWGAAALICASCVLTGSHAVVDVLAGVGVAVLAWRHDAVWQMIVKVTQWLGDSWTATRFGPVRVISHSTWSFAGAAVGAALVLWLAGSDGRWATAAVILAGLISAGAWGHWLEGGGRLSRPFGYYGYLFGSAVALMLLWWFNPLLAEPLMAAYAAAAPFAQALGRLRCVVQGCCHGRPVIAAYGMRVTHPMSRVTTLGNLCGVSIHPTPLYSIVGNILLGTLLVRLWQGHAPWTLIAGLYLALSSLARFAEEHYRGEPQTEVKKGLPVYQWLAIGLFVAGLAFAAIPGAPVASAQSMSWSNIATAAAAGVTAALLMSVDFPDSNRRFSRLTVGARQSSSA
jgi:protein-S-isoprenylcysteine O-methyltransferase Ste14